MGQKVVLGTQQSGTTGQGVGHAAGQAAGQGVGHAAGGLNPTRPSRVRNGSDGGVVVGTVTGVVGAVVGVVGTLARLEWCLKGGSNGCGVVFEGWVSGCVRWLTGGSVVV